MYMFARVDCLEHDVQVECLHLSKEWNVYLELDKYIYKKNASSVL
jgi:hypothetical protein